MVLYGRGTSLMYVHRSFCARDRLTSSFLQAAPLQPNPPPKVHERVITWIEQHPVEAGELITASADGTVKVWRTPS